VPRDGARPARRPRPAAAHQRRSRQRRRLGARVPVGARRHDLLGPVRGAAEHRRQARPQPPAGPMKFELSDDQALLRNSTRDFLASEFPLERSRRVMEESTEGYEPGAWRRLAEMGYLGLTVPAAAGGQGLGAIELAIVLEEIGRACMPGPYLDAVLAADVLAAAGGQEALVADVAAGRKLVTIARDDASEPVRLERGRL